MLVIPHIKHSQSAVFELIPLLSGLILLFIKAAAKNTTLFVAVA